MDVSISIKVVYALTELSQYFTLKSKSEYTGYHEKESRMWATLIPLQRLQQGRPKCAWVALHLEEAQKQVQQMDDCRKQFHYHNFASRWKQFGDRCIGQFFNIKGSKRISNITYCMLNENGELETEPNNVRETAMKFYVALLSEEPISKDIRQNRMKV